MAGDGDGEMTDDDEGEWKDKPQDGRKCVGLRQQSLLSQRNGQPKGDELILHTGHVSIIRVN